MSDEIKVTEEKKEECKCFCRSEGFRNFLIVAIGSFVGVYCALSLFAALHRPPMVKHCHFGCHRGCPLKVVEHREFRGEPGDFHKKMPKDFGPRTPFEAPRPNVKD